MLMLTGGNDCNDFEEETMMMMMLTTTVVMMTRPLADCWWLGPMEVERGSTLKPLHLQRHPPF